MFPRLRRQPRAFFERTRNGREQIVIERRHSHSGYRERDSESSPEDSFRDVAREQDQRVLLENYALNDQNQRLLQDNERLQRDNQRLLRDNQALTRQVHNIVNERDFLAQQNQQGDAQQETINNLERRLARERRKLRDERAEREARDRARETNERERASRAREAAVELRELRETERKWGAAVVELTREIEDWVRINQDKERRIRTLEDWLRRLGVGGVR